MYKELKKQRITDYSTSTLTTASSHTSTACVSLYKKGQNLAVFNYLHSSSFVLCERTSPLRTITSRRAAKGVS